MSAQLLISASYLMLVAGEVTSQPSSGLPFALDAAFAHRISLDTVHARYTFTRHWHRNVSPTVQHREDRIAQGDIFSINRGDDDGVIYGPRGVETPDFGVGLVFGAHGELSLRSSGEQWLYYFDDVNVSIKDFNAQESQLGDLRSVGCGEPFPRETPIQLFQRWAKFASEYEWQETRTDDGLIKISATKYGKKLLDNKRSTLPRMKFEMLIDPGKEYAILRWAGQAFDENGKPDGKTVVCDSEYKILDGHWMPAMSRSENKAFKEELIIHEMTINRPEHPKTLTPKVMDLPVGVTLHYPQKWGRLPDLNALRVWDRDNLREWNDWQAVKGTFDTTTYDSLMIKSGTEGCPGKYPSWWKEGGESFGLKDVDYHPGLWEAYVRRWVYKNTHKREQPITDKQKTIAAAILKDCQTDAFPIFQRVDKQLTALEAELTKPGIKDADRKVTETKRDRLVEPITAIFATRLKPRLENMLDEKQRQEAKEIDVKAKPLSPQKQDKKQ